MQKTVSKTVSSSTEVDFFCDRQCKKHTTATRTSPGNGIYFTYKCHGGCNRSYSGSHSKCERCNAYLTTCLPDQLDHDHVCRPSYYKKL